MADRSKKQVSIPEWQRSASTNNQNLPTPLPEDVGIDNESTTPATSSSLSLHEQAKLFLEDESIKNASRDRKIAFLQTKGIPLDEINKLLDSQQPSQSKDEEESELKTVHDSNDNTQLTSDKPESDTSQRPSDSFTSASSEIQRDAPPIITYPEFLLKPQKPPPLVTFQRLAYAAYAIAGVSALTYSASKYIIQPMLETLTEARHELASGTIDNLEKLNSKLESSVSHVPYIESSTVLKKKKDMNSEDEDVESIDSDPTELFHRDIATQTTPQRSPTPSDTDPWKAYTSNEADSALDIQCQRLASLQMSLQGRLSDLNDSTSDDRLKEVTSNMQTVLDKIESTYNPFRSDFSALYPSFNEDKNKGKKGGDSNEANKFKAEIRALKGAFLSSRNFPSARPTVPFSPTAK